MKKFMSLLNEKSSIISRIDVIVMLIMVFVYGIISFYHLGDLHAPQTYYTFQSNGDSVVVNLKKETEISNMMYWVGIKDGDIDVMISNDGIEYYHYKDITTYGVLTWETTDFDVKALSIKFVGKSIGATLGEVALYDKYGALINNIDSNNPLTDELDLVPKNKSYLNSLYFDEVYFARSAYEYVHGISCFEWSHPPLGKLIMAIPVLIFGYSPFAVRLMGNIAGILLIPVMYILAKKIFKNRKYAFLGAILMMFDNFHFAHTRIALVDGFQVLFILLSVLFMKNYLDMKKDDSFKKKTIKLLLSGFFIGCAIATKWNACYVALGLAIVFFIHLLKQYNVNIISFCKKNIDINKINKFIVFSFLVPVTVYYFMFLLFNKEVAYYILISYLTIIILYMMYYFFRFLYQDKYLLELFIVCFISFIFIPIIVYILSYILFPNVNYYDKTLTGILDQIKLMYDYHANLVATHPFSSSWYEWPIMYKPVWFYTSDVINAQRMTIVDIGNPLIWWFGIISFIYLVISSIKKKESNNIFILIFILVSFIPYIFVGRIMFMYHFFITLPFLMLGIVAFIKWITERIKSDKVYWLYISLVIIMFIIFYPVVSGMMIDEDYIESIKWLSSWYF